MTWKRWIVASALAAGIAGAPSWAPSALAQDTPKEEPKKPDEGDKKDKPDEGAKLPDKKTKNGVKPYDEGIKDAKSDNGLFLVHRIEDKVYYEIPTAALGLPLLWVTQLEQTSTGRDIMGTLGSDRVVRWDYREDLDCVCLREVHFDMRAEAKDPINNAVQTSSIAPIIQMFKVEAYGKDKSPVIDVTSLFTNDVPELSVKNRLGAAGLDPKRTFIDTAKSFPENVEVKVMATYNPKPPGGPGGDFFGGPAGGTISAVVHHSMVRLPDEPMKPRKFDDRVGYFTVGFDDYSDTSNHQVEPVQYISRWRLEKKDPSSDVSEPKKQIVYYISREVPDKFRPFIKKGVEDWQKAFEKAGFKNAIVAKDQPTPQEDPDFDAEDARYSVIRWLPTNVQNAMGPSVTDPRTGEILEADIQMYHNVLALARDWYFVQASPSDERAQTLPLPDDLVGELIRYVVAHEVGHTLGFPHNMKASSSYTVDELRNKEFTEKNGTEASIMDYGRFNYVAQPGDGARLIPIIGPYDEFAVEWGYKEFKDAKDYPAEKKELDSIVSRQRNDAKVRFGHPNPGEDPTQQTEDLGNDPLAASELGLKNIDRVAGYLIKATCKPGQDYSLLTNMYEQLLNQRTRELNHVANLVGGFVRDNVWFGEGEKQYDAVSTERQKKAVGFLMANAFHVPPALVSPEILLRIEASGAAERILDKQTATLGVLLNPNRLERMAEHATRSETAYRPLDLITDLTTGIFEETAAEKVKIDLDRRNLQRAYVQILIDNVTGESTSSDLPALARGELKRLKEIVAKAIVRGSDDPTTAFHLQDLTARIDQALDPHNAPAGGIAGRRIPIEPQAIDETF
jgi:Met-zincin/Domain of unknown function (DUF5117)/Domain of unknown function (DUF5118)